MRASWWRRGSRAACSTMGDSVFDARSSRPCRPRFLLGRKLAVAPMRDLDCAAALVEAGLGEARVANRETWVQRHARRAQRRRPRRSCGRAVLSTCAASSVRLSAASLPRARAVAAHGVVGLALGGGHDTQRRLAAVHSGRQVERADGVGAARARPELAQRPAAASPSTPMSRAENGRRLCAALAMRKRALVTTLRTRPQDH